MSSLGCSFGGRVLERPDGRWMLKEIDWEHDCGHERGDPTGQPRASSSATSKGTSQHRSFSPPKPKSATKDTFTISSMNGPSSRLPSFTKTTQKPKPKPIVTIPEVEIDPLQDSFSQRTVSKPKARKRRRISASPTSDADNRGVKEESPFFDPTLPDFQTLMHRPNSASSPKSQTRDDTSLSQRCSPIRDSQVTDERPRDTYTPQEYLPRARQSQLALDPVSKGSDIRTSAAAAPVSDSSQPHEGQVPSRGLATHSRHISRSPESTVNSSISITNSMDQWSTSSERLLSPLVDEAAPLKAWLNSLNPGLGKAVGDRLFRIGITSSERLCSGLTSERESTQSQLETNWN